MCSGKVVNMRDYKPHISVEVKCLGCDNEWIAIAECGVVIFECPECRTMKGISTGLIEPEVYLECAIEECKSPFFCISPKGPVCTKCGTLKKWEDLPPPP